MKDGDRYWYENRGVEGFSLGILKLLKFLDIVMLKNNFNNFKKFGLMYEMGLIFVFNLLCMFCSLVVRNMKS